MEKPRALLISPPVYDFALYDLFLKPYGLLRIGRWLSDSGWDTVFADSLSYEGAETLSGVKKPVRNKNGTGKFPRTPVKTPEKMGDIKRRYSRYGIDRESFENKIRSVKRPDVVLVTSVMTYWYPGVAEAVKLVKKIWPDSPVIAGGIYATLLPEHCREKCGADYVVRGEAFPGLKGIFDRLGLPCPDEPPGEKLLSSPVWKDSAVLRLNRGCPLNCRYCASRSISGFSAGSSDEVYKQIEEHVNNWNTKNFAFYDDALLFRKDEIFIPLLERIIESGMDLNFYLPNAVHISYIDSALAALMKRAGFREIRLGFESSSSEFHQKNDRKVSTSLFPDIIKSLRSGGFNGEEIIVYLLAGLPGQEAGEVRDSIEYLGKLGVRISLSEFSPVPGSQMWNESKDKSIFPIEEEPLFHNNSVFPLQWERFTVKDMAELKQLSRTIRNT